MADRSDWIPVPGRRAAARVIDGRAVLMDPDEDRLHHINEVGTFIWTLIVERQLTTSEIATRVAEAFDVDEATARADVESFVNELLGHNFIEPSSRRPKGANGVKPPIG